MNTEQIKNIKDLLLQGKIKEANELLNMLPFHPETIAIYKKFTFVPKLDFINSIGFIDKADFTACINLMNKNVLIGKDFFINMVKDYEDFFFVLLHERNHIWRAYIQGRDNDFNRNIEKFKLINKKRFYKCLGIYEDIYINTDLLLTIKIGKSFLEKNYNEVCELHTLLKGGTEDDVYIKYKNDAQLFQKIWNMPDEKIDIQANNVEDEITSNNREYLENFFKEELGGNIKKINLDKDKMLTDFNLNNLHINFDKRETLIRKVSSFKENIISKEAASDLTRNSYMPPSRLNRKDFLFLASGNNPVKWKTEVKMDYTKYSLFVDVSSSMKEYYYLISYIIDTCRSSIDRLFHVSGEIVEVPLSEKKFLFTTQKTNLTKFANFVINNNINKCIIFTDDEDEASLPANILNSLEKKKLYILKTGKKKIKCLTKVKNSIIYSIT